ncbi:MAG: phage tail protein [Oscillospiraceae bacterium]
MQTSGSAAIKKLIQLVKSALSDKMDKAGGTLRAMSPASNFTGTWLQTLEATDLGRAPGKIAVLDEVRLGNTIARRRSSNPISAQAAAESMSVRCSTEVYPVGSIYMSVNSTNPKTLFGGTWVQIKDRFLLAAGTTYKAGATGGEAAHTLTASEMPSHNHAVYYPNAGAADHSAPGNYPDGPSDSTYYAIGSYTSSAGGGTAHNNMPPYLSVYVWKRTA